MLRQKTLSLAEIREKHKELNPLVGVEYFMDNYCYLILEVGEADLVIVTHGENEIRRYRRKGLTVTWRNENINNTPEQVKTDEGKDGA